MRVCFLSYFLIMMRQIPIQIFRVVTRVQSLHKPSSKSETKIMVKLRILLVVTVAIIYLDLVRRCNEFRIDNFEYIAFTYILQITTTTTEPPIPLDHQDSTDFEIVAEAMYNSCPKLREGLNERTVAECAQISRPKENAKGSFTIQCLFRISISHFLPIFSEWGSTATIFKTKCNRKRYVYHSIIV